MKFYGEKQAMQLVFNANEHFRKKDYNHSLNLYTKALSVLKIKASDSKSLDKGVGALILSSRGLNYFCLRDYQSAEKDFNLVLEAKPYDTTTLNRRAVMYLKTKKYAKAAEDIAILYELQPESIKVLALVMEIRQKAERLWKNELQALRKLQTESGIPIENNQTDQEQDLNFTNLRKLERVFPKKQKVRLQPRLSGAVMVQFKEDSVVTYERDQEPMRPKTRLSKSMIYDILELQKQEMPDNVQEGYECEKFRFVQDSKNKKQKKSILKCSIISRLPSVNKTQSSAIQTLQSIVEPMDVTRVTDIDGRVIRQSEKVRFVQSQLSQNKEVFNANKLKDTVKRKSSLRQPSILIQKLNHQLQSPSQGRSPSRVSFSNLKNLDGSMLCRQSNQPRKSKESKCSQSGSDSGQEHNIFGNREIENIQKQIQDVFGYSDSGPTVIKTNSSNVPKKSILKAFEPINRLPSDSKPKKSVLFR